MVSKQDRLSSMGYWELDCYRQLLWDELTILQRMDVGNINSEEGKKRIRQKDRAMFATQILQHRVGLLIEPKNIENDSSLKALHEYHEKRKQNEIHDFRKRLHGKTYL